MPPTLSSHHVHPDRSSGSSLPSPVERVFDEDDAWAFVRGVAKLTRAGAVTTDPFGVSLRGRTAALVPGGGRGASLAILPDRDPVWESRAAFSEEARRLLDVTVPLCVGHRARDLVVAHLGQSLDGRVATPDGVSPLITGVEDIRHTHMMRALFDAVIVGATTIAVDDPRLTTRLVPGDHPVRVVLDPRGRLPHASSVFTDGAARSLVITTTQHAAHYAPLRGKVEVLTVGDDENHLSLVRVREELCRRGLRRLFIEGGGVTVSRFIDEGLVDRLQIAVAPMIIGTGEPAIRLDSPHLTGLRSRRFLFGNDVLFDFDLSHSRKGDGCR